MSHELYSAQDMVYVGETPWHGLGVKVDSIKELPSILDWSIVKRPVHVEGKHGGYKHAEQYAGLVRSSDGKIMAIVGNDYEPHQNRKLWSDVFAPFVDSGELIAETAGMLQDGNRIWLLAKIPGAVFDVGAPGHSDYSNGYVLLATSHDSSLATCAKGTSVRVVCQNTLSMAIGHDGRKASFRQKHTSVLKVSDAKSVVQDALAAFNGHADQAKRLKARPVSPLALQAYVAELVQPELLVELKLPDRGERFAGKTIEQILSFSADERQFEMAVRESGSRTTKALLEAIPRQLGGFDKTLWGAANGVSYWTDHVRGRSADTRLNSAWFGPSDQLKRDAFALADTYAERMAA